MTAYSNLGSGATTSRPPRIVNRQQSGRRSLTLCFCLRKEVVTDAPLQLDFKRVLLHPRQLRPPVRDDFRPAARQRDGFSISLNGLPAAARRAVADVSPGVWTASGVMIGSGINGGSAACTVALSRIRKDPARIEEDRMRRGCLIRLAVALAVILGAVKRLQRRS